MEPSIEPRQELLGLILQRIHKEERLLTIRRVVLFSTIFACSVIGLVPTFNMLMLDISSSGFNNFFSLLFSDFSVVTTYWQSFVMILLETLPALSLALFLAVILTFLESAKFITKDIKKLNLWNQKYSA